MTEVMTITDKHLITSKIKTEQIFVTVYVDKQLFGIPVEKVQDILIPEQIAHIPLAADKVAGSINLRGRIVTVIDFRKCLGLPKIKDNRQHLATVEVGEELYSIRVDDVGTVMTIKTKEIEHNPSTMDKKWQGVSSGVVKLDKKLMIILDVEALIRNKVPLELM